MQGVLVDLYVPRKCAATSKCLDSDERSVTILPACITDRLITSKDHASVQINVVDVDANGRALNTYTSFALCGQVRSQGESDDSLNRLATKAGCRYFSSRSNGVLMSLRSFVCVGHAVLRNVWSYQK